MTPSTIAKKFTIARDINGKYLSRDIATDFTDTVLFESDTDITVSVLISLEGGPIRLKFKYFPYDPSTGIINQVYINYRLPNGNFSAASINPSYIDLYAYDDSYESSISISQINSTDNVVIIAAEIFNI